MEVIFRRWNLIINMNNHIFLYLSPFTIYNRKISCVFAHFFDIFHFLYKLFTILTIISYAFVSIISKNSIIKFKYIMRFDNTKLFLHLIFWHICIFY